MRVRLILWSHVFARFGVLHLWLRNFPFNLLTRWQMMLLRQRMAFLVDNLQYYLQARTVNAIFLVSL